MKEGSGLRISLQDIVQKYKKNPQDTGSAAFQICQKTEEIINLSEHLRSNKKDYSAKRGLLNKVSSRKKLLQYCKKNERPVYDEVIQELNLRDKF